MTRPPHGNEIFARDGALAVMWGAAFAAVSAWIVAPQVLQTEHLEPYLSPNFGEYCEVLGLWNRPEGNWQMQPLRRTMAASVPAHLFVGALGVIDALAAGAFVCTAAVGAGLYIWACALGGRFAGIMAVVAALGTGTLPLLTRHFTFYPAIVASFVATAALSVWAVRASETVRPWAILCAACAASAALLVDVRGIIWASPALALLGLASFGCTGWGRRLLCLGVIALPLWASFGLGNWNASGMQVVSLEEQVDVRPLAYLHGARGPGMEPPFAYESRFFWGLSKLNDLPKTAQFLVNQFGLTSVEDVRDVRAVETQLFESQVAPWERGALVALIVVVLGMRRDPRGLVALALTGAPFAAAQMGIHAHHEIRVRFLFQTLPLLAVLYGLSARFVLAWLLQLVGHTRNTPRARQAREAPERSPLWRWMGGAVAALVTANCVGLIPGPLHMDAAWRGMPWRVANGHISTYKRLVDDGQTDAVLAGDPWGNQAGSEERWTFRQAACEPLLRVGQDDRDDAFESRLYAPLKQRAGHAQKPSVGFAPNMRDQAVQ
ncbi:MAG: hypothetical protein VX944_04865 [Myxococcota bacterium]|nr:hypothetical protein [Myxococcota bacterium]